MKLGARMLKTGIGVALTISIAQWLPFVQPAMPGLTAVIGLQQTPKRSLNTFFDRMIAAFLGGVFAVFMYYFFGNNPLIIGITITLFIGIMNALKMTNVITLACIAIVVIMLADRDVMVRSAVARVIENMLGVFVSLIVNVFILPPKYDTMLYEEVNSTTTEILIRLRAILRKNGEYSSLSSDISWAEDRLKNVKSQYQLLMDEQVWVKTKRVGLKRKIVVFRSFITSLEEALNLLIIIHSHTNDVFQLPYDLRLRIRERIETLCAAHEQIFLKFDGRISPEEVNFFKSTMEYRQKLLDNIYLESQVGRGASREDFERSNTLMLITSAMINYEEALIHLNMLVRSYRLHHEDDDYQADSLSGHNQ
ncbi:FUSC family protein [Aerococcus kribbianus]|uniref:Aromatic acid exporter family protein n=1 Tax=Aerococcus kribbianus TaxID=2999064 RepID=A0A9X3FP34_9LACT|nr:MULTISPECIES: aromatic acid exporter family protein [unclassified Aerococcus]MCZ0718123.1 aromatic acid exporter family protein [Aerococcus sp. YH-aer221]MCZ0726308.1 aromatic acid exporter family protein [Aerococcus sp. YH-aer222]